MRILYLDMDTTRADYLSCYGYAKTTTPHLDALAREGVVFDQVVAPVPLTLPSHSSMLTGPNPTYHGVHLNLGYQLGPSNQPLSELSLFYFLRA